jgi:hypothetical protein
MRLRLGAKVYDEGKPAWLWPYGKTPPICVKESVSSSNNTQNIAIARNYFDAALGHLTTEHATDAHPESPRLQLAG